MKNLEKDKYNNAIADWFRKQFVSDYKEDLQASQLLDDEAQRKQTAAVTALLESKMNTQNSFSASADTGSNNTMIIVGVAVIAIGGISYLALK